MSAYLTEFWGRLSMVPGIVFNNVPAFFGFAASDYVAAMAISALPQMDGSVGMIERAGIFGAAKVVDFATWDAFNRGYAPVGMSFNLGS